MLAVRAGALAALLAVAIALVFLQFDRVGGGYLTDDAYISFRYALNLAEGNGPVWNPGERVEGYTNFGWVLLLAGGIKLGIDPVDASRGMGVLSSLGALAVVPFLAAQLRPAWTWRWWLLSAGGVIGLALNNGFSLWTFAGLETTGFTFLLTLAVALHLYEDRTDALPAWSAVTFVAAALVRPDAVVAVGVVGLFKLLRLLTPRSELARELRRAVLWGAIFGAAFGAYWLWRWSYYGDFFPNTYYLKSGGTSRSLLERGWEYVRDFLVVYWMWLAVLALFSVRRELRAAYRPAACLLAICVVWSVYVVDSGGDWMPFFRFMVPIVPLAYVLIAHGAIDAGEWLGARTRGRADVVAGGTAIVMLAVLAFSAVRPHDSMAARNPAGFQTRPEILAGSVDDSIQGDIGTWMRENFPAHYEVALIPSGIVPYYSRLPSIDMLGLNDRHIARRDIPLGDGVAGHEKEDGGYVVGRKPEIIWLGLSIEQEKRDEIEDYMPPRWTDWVAVKANIVNNAYLWFLYRPVAVPMGDGWLNLIVRQDVDLPALPAPPP